MKVNSYLLSESMGKLCMWELAGRVEEEEEEDIVKEPCRLSVFKPEWFWVEEPLW